MEPPSVIGTSPRFVRLQKTLNKYQKYNLHQSNAVYIFRNYLILPKLFNNMITTIKNLLQKAGIARPEINAMEAYEIWSNSYDNQPGNLMLDLDELIFSSLVANIDLDNKRVADVGCGTGRHWQKIY